MTWSLSLGCGGCAGYRNSFPFLEKDHPDLAECFNPRKLYKHIIPPQYGPDITFYGFARPAFGSLPPTSEMQARYVSQSGQPRDGGLEGR
jgi:dimethylaniline monooxygenase (N-oxide forming)